MLLSVVIPATDQPPTLARCLAALEGSDEPHTVEVVTSPARSGPAAARNAGVARTAGEVLVFVDSDVEVHPDALRRLREVLERDPAVDAVFGTYDDRPFEPSIVSRFRNLLHHHVHASSPGHAATFWAGLGAVRRDAFDAVGGFDAERFPCPSIEDIELGVRLRAAGRRIMLEPAARGTHLKRWTLRSMVRTDLSARGAPWVLLQLQRGAGSSLNLAWRHRGAAAAAVLATGAAVAGRPRLAGAALAAMAAHNTSFYLLLWRCGGPRLAVAGVPLHLVHHLTAAASVPAGLALWVHGGRQ
jgi:GT2 family glycosyltransferase